MSRISLSAIDGPFKNSFGNLLEPDMHQSTCSVPAVVQQSQTYPERSTVAPQSEQLYPQKQETETYKLAQFQKPSRVSS